MAAGSGKSSKKTVILMTIFALALSATMVMLAVGPTFRRDMTAKALLSNGQPATATIISLTDTGDRINMLPVMMINLQVTASDGTTFDSQAQEIVSPAKLGGLQPGRQVAVRYNPADEHLVAIAGEPP
jgi:hypothetical protein